MHLHLLAATCLAGVAAAAPAENDAAGCGGGGLLPSMHMLDSIVSRGQGIHDSGAASSTLESGVLAQAVEALVAQYPHTRARYAGFLTDVLDLASARGLTDAAYAAGRPLDRFSLATAITAAVDAGVAPVTARSLRARDAIRASLAMQKRNPDRGLWYFVYPEWSYLDGIFSLLPFMAAQDRVDHQDMLLQVDLLREHCAQPETGLLVHGYDWSRRAVWADKTTGASHYVWGRSLAWFAAGLVQTWERLSCGSVAAGDAALQLCGPVRGLAAKLSAALVEHADPETGAWWQLVTFPGEQGNYLESSSTALFVFSLLKAVRTGLLDGDVSRYTGAALKAYKHTLHEFVTHGDDGTIGFDKTVAVCSLNSTATYEYYTKQPILPNSLLGESAFILASLEVERLKHHM